MHEPPAAQLMGQRDLKKTTGTSTSTAATAWSSRRTANRKPIQASNVCSTLVLDADGHGDDEQREPEALGRERGRP